MWRASLPNCLHQHSSESNISATLSDVCLFMYTCVHYSSILDRNTYEKNLKQLHHDQSLFVCLSCVLCLSSFYFHFLGLLVNSFLGFKSQILCTLKAVRIFNKKLDILSKSNIKIVTSCFVQYQLTNKLT